MLVAMKTPYERYVNTLLQTFEKVKFLNEEITDGLILTEEWQRVREKQTTQNRIHIDF